MGVVVQLRAAASSLLSRYQALRNAGFTFGDKRDVYGVLGYPPHGTLTVADFLDRYERGGIAARVVEVPPNGTWAGEMYLEENEDPENETQFEKAWTALEKRLALRARFRQVDVLQRLSTYAVLLLGTKDGNLEKELPRGGPENLIYVQPYLGSGGPARANRRSQAQGGGEGDVTILEYDLDASSPRFGQPLFYQLRRSDLATDALNKPIHWTRVVHVAEGTLRDDVFGRPALERSWNYYEDLDKVVGGGSEAFWMRANAGIHLNIDKDLQLNTQAAADGKTELDRLREQAEEYQHQLTRMIRTRGVEVNQLGSDVANFQSPADVLVTLIAGCEGIPKRLLVGSERGELASTQDRENFRDMIGGRQENFAGPQIVRAFADRLIEFGYLPKPKDYKVKWPQIETLSEVEKATGATNWASVNSSNNSVVFTEEEIRERWAGLKPLTDAQKKAIEDEKAKKLESEKELIAAKNPPEDERLVKAKVQKLTMKPGKKLRTAEEEAEDDETVRILAEAIDIGAHDVVAQIIGLGGPGSGNFGHAGRPGQVGGSAKGIRGSIQPGEVVAFHTPTADEQDETYEVVEDRDDRVLIRTQNPYFKDATIIPTQAVLKTDLKRVGPEKAERLKAAIRESKLWPVSIVDHADGTVEIGGPRWVLRDHQREAESRGFGTYLSGESLLILPFGLKELGARLLGGPGSGNFGHSGRPGQIGGSAPRGGIGQPASFYKPMHETGRDTKERFSDGKGNYTKERSQLHDAIIEKALKGTTPVDNPTSTILGGAPGVGKSTIVESEKIGAENTVQINVDDIRNDLPEYAKGPDGKRPPLTAFTHEEASDISAKLIKRAASEKRNIVLDGTGDSTVEKLGGKVAVLRSKGHRVEATYVTTTLATSTARAESRSQNPNSSSFGRKVPRVDMEHMHRAVSRVFPEAIRQGMFDKASLFDNELDKNPRLVATAEGKKLTIHNEALWATFLAKAKQ